MKDVKRLLTATFLLFACAPAVITNGDACTILSETACQREAECGVGYADCFSDVYHDCCEVDASCDDVIPNVTFDDVLMCANDWAAASCTTDVMDVPSCDWIQ